MKTGAAPIEPEWRAADCVRAFCTTRADRAGLGDNPAAAEAHPELGHSLPSEPKWLRQVHGTRVVHLRDWHDGIEADAAWTDRVGEVVAIVTADCLPILVADRAGSVVAGIHGGWRSLAGGIVDKTLAGLPIEGSALSAWIGPAICGDCYQVGDEVRAAFVSSDPALAAAFRPDGERWRADLKSIAARQLREQGVEVADSGRCTFEEPGAFFSFRREGRTGRMATLAWIRSD